MPIPLSPLNRATLNKIILKEETLKQAVDNGDAKNHR